MKKINLLSVLLLSIIFVSSCSSDDSNNDQNEDEQTEELSDEPLMGEVFGESFSAEGGTADFVSVNQSDVIRISLYNQDVTCDDFEDSWISLVVPREVGVYENGATGRINDPNSDDFSSLSNVKVELVSFDNNTVQAKVLIDRPSLDSYVNGMFEIQVCYSGE